MRGGERGTENGNGRAARPAADFLFSISHFPGLRGGEIRLEDALGGNGIERALKPPAARARLPQRALRGVRGEVLVHECDPDPETPVQPLCEPPREPAYFVRRPVGTRGNSDHQQHRPPFGHQSGDRVEAGAVVRGRDRSEGMSERGLQISDRHTDALLPVIEREDRSGPRVSGER